MLSLCTSKHFPRESSTVRIAKKIILILFVFLVSATHAKSSEDLSNTLIRDDINKLLTANNLPNKLINYEVKQSKANKVFIECTKEFKFNLKVEATTEEWPSVLYYGLQKLGFLFPHPRWSLAPKLGEINKKGCFKTHYWKPRLNLRGFHLHNQHPNEWVHGFFMNKPKIAEDYIRWLVRNGQNYLQIQMIDFKGKKNISNFKNQLKFAKAMGLKVGLSVSFALVQQESQSLIPLISAITGLGDKHFLKKNIQQLIKDYSFDHLIAELGTTEFSSTHYKRTLNWMNKTSELLESHNKKLYIKVHVSSNQSDKKFGNFNFLPAHANKNVGILPHTVFFYGLKDTSAPMYGQKNFSSIKDFMLKEASKRDVIYYPETSYFIGMDIDVPLLLTDYLLARHQDLLFLEDNKINKQVNFTTGMELGYWLFDWTLALMTQKNTNYNIGLKLLGEDLEAWDKVINYQKTYFNKNQAIQSITASNLMDEVNSKHRIHKRNLLKELEKNETERYKEEKILEEAVRNQPPLHKIKNKELKQLLEVTFLRVSHAYYLRKAIKYKSLLGYRSKLLKKATNTRVQAHKIILKYIKNYNRYPDAFIFQKHRNPTSYQFGYGWTASNLHYWVREEEMVKKNKYYPWFKNIYNPFRILLF